MRGRYKILITCVLGVLLVAATWTAQINRSITEAGSESVTHDIEYAYGPLLGNITLIFPPTMYDGVTVTCKFTIVIGIESKTPLDLTIRAILLLLTPWNNGSPMLDEVGRAVGGYPLLFVANATSLRFSGLAEMVPEIPNEKGDIYLSLGLDYRLTNNTLAEPNSWGNVAGTPYLVKVNILPSYLRPESWYYAFWLGSLVVCVAYIIDSRYRILYALGKYHSTVES